MLRRLRGLTGVEEDGGDRPLHCDPEQEMMKGKQPKADEETTREDVCCSHIRLDHRSSVCPLRKKIVVIGSHIRLDHCSSMCPLRKKIVVIVLHPTVATSEHLQDGQVVRQNQWGKQGWC
ncbi:hypothetical protein NDU88_003853 [Pleurodeles waltl]|uniref:Uncharacterized protein n=1 Tax=Pleurodeles waltl TaxID=8319 RepID=A0AAV7SH69_PLEWA|nr:hypothetical protein NDU88_003853 [Pleurodeles waltl]